MSNYRRLISYIYAYEGGIKGKNVGFAKLEVRNGQCKLQVNVRNVYIGSQDTGVYLLSGSEEILVGRIFIRNGAGEFRAVVAVGNVAGSGHTIDQCYGLTVHNLSDSWQSYTTIWEDAVAHAAEVDLEEAASQQVEKKEPVESSVAKAVEEEIEAQSRQKEEAQKKEQAGLKEGGEVPSSVIPPDEGEDKEIRILRPADMGVMEIRPMEVLPIGKDLTADRNEETGEESQESVQVKQENPEVVQEKTETMQEYSGFVQEEPEPMEKEPEHPEEPAQGGEGGMQENSGTVQSEPEFMQSGPEPEGQKPAQEADLVIPEPEQQPRQQPERQPEQQPERQSGQQSGTHAGTQENSSTQPPRQNQWGQTGMLFPPNWFTRPNRQNRQSQQVVQPVPDRQDQRMGTAQPGGRMQQENQNHSGNQPAGSNEIRIFQTGQMPEPAASSEPVPQRTQTQGAILQPAPQPSAGQSNTQQVNPPPQPAGTIMPGQNMTDDEPKIDSVWQRFYKTYPKIQAFDYNGGCEIITIKPQDIGLLPRETWGYGNNSFLLHGYYNHRYLIFARLNNPKGQPRFLLGVPGHYYSNEKYMAAMFGFPNFVLSKVQPAGEDRFGYWYTDVRLGS